MKTSLFAMIAMLPALALAQGGGSSGSHGGDGLLKAGKPYLLDLIEQGNGVELAPVFRPGPVAEDLRLRVRSAIGYLKVNSDLVASKIAQIQDADATLAWSLLRAMEMYNWSLVDQSLVNIPDEDSSLDYDPKDLVQLAIRRDQTIRISRLWWEQLDEGNRVALIFHEVVYALIKPVTTPQGLKQLSRQARDIAGYFFSESFLRRGRQGLLALRVQDKLPFQVEPVALYREDKDQIEYRPRIYIDGWMKNSNARGLAMRIIRKSDSPAEVASKIQTFCSPDEGWRLEGFVSVNYYQSWTFLKHDTLPTGGSYILFFQGDEEAERAHVFKRPLAQLNVGRKDCVPKIEKVVSESLPYLF